MPIRNLMASLLLILVATASSNAYDFWSQDPFERKSTSIKLKQSARDKVIQEEVSKPARKVPEDSCDVPVDSGLKATEETVPPETKPIPKKKATNVVKDKPKANKDEHVKILIHSTDRCMYCDKLINEIKPLEDKYEIEVIKHDGAFYTDYRRYVYSFPYTEFLYDGKVKLYRYGYMDLKTVEYIIDNQLK